MSVKSDKCLINFLVSVSTVEAFDRICFLSGKNRTQVLTEMMKQRIASSGRKFVLEAEKEARLNKQLKALAERQNSFETIEQPRQWSEAVRNRLNPTFTANGASA